MKNITKEMIVRYFNTIMPHFHCQSQLQNDRYTFYCILHQIFLNRLEGNIIHIYYKNIYLYCLVTNRF
jgi:hypothetical protein